MPTTNVLETFDDVWQMARRKIKPKNDDEIKVISKTILKEAKKRAKYEMDCLTELVLQEARIAARYARKRPFYIA